MSHPRLRTTFVAAMLAVLIGCAGQRTESVRLYVLDGGTLHVTDPARFQLTKADVMSCCRALDRFLEDTKAQLWIQHDFNAHVKLKKAPDYYE